MSSKEELVGKIEEARTILNSSIDFGENSDMIYENSIQLDKLIEQYIAAEY